MKRLLLVRHAKSDWSDGSLRDFDRPLNSRGRHDAPRMAKYIARQGLQPTFMLASAAARTYATARLFADELGIAENDISTSEELYECSSAQLIQAITALPDLHDTAAVFAHNPATTTVIGKYSDDYVANVATCGVGVISVVSDSWADLVPDVARLEDLWLPKTVLEAYA